MLSIIPQTEAGTEDEWKECNDATSCQSTTVEGTSYKCHRTNAGAWQWDTGTLPLETACSDTYDNDCDTLIDNSDSTSCDATPPTAGTYTINSQSSGTIYTSGSLSHAWSGFSDAGSGLYSFEIWRATYNSNNCKEGDTSGCSWGNVPHHIDTTNPATGSWLETVTADYMYGWHSSDKAGNWIKETTPFRVVYDATAPTRTVSINSDAQYTNSRTVTLTISCTDTGSGMKDYRYNCDGSWSSWVSCTGCSVIQSCTLSTSDGSKTAQIECRDNANNVGSASDSIILDTTPPTGSVSINSGATYTTSTSVTLTLSCTDTNGCSQMKFSNDDSTWSTPENYAASKTWTLTSGDGTKTVYVRFKDSAGNWMTTSASDSIILDTTPPTASSLTVTSSSATDSSGWSTTGSINLGWTTGSDATTHVKNFEVLRSCYTPVSRSVETCPGGSSNYYVIYTTGDNSTLTYQDTGRFSNTTYYYKIQSFDAVDNSVNSTQQSITVDTDNPGVTVITPASGQIFKVNSITLNANYLNTYLVNCNATHNAISTWYDMSGDNAVSGTASYTFTSLPDGVYTFTARCWDQAGNKQQNSVSNVIVDTTNPTAGTYTINGQSSGTIYTSGS
ncbi:MAG: hypothetical protein HZC29_05665, partial [Thaumarchaeota archaeon]|nr:hypothetical protein [Nitrososphaerota archaeon]